MVRLLARECLEEAGMRVVEAEDGNQALEVFALQQPDLVFLDVDMPGKNGFQVCEEIRANPLGKNVPVLIATGADDKESIDRGFQVGATQYKTKPVNWPLLSRDVRYMLRAAKAFLDIKAQENKLRYFAYFDHLTELPNRRSFSEQLHRNLLAGQETGRQTGLIILGIDHFKRINDSLGYERGDQLLRNIADRIHGCLASMGHVISDHTHEDDIVHDEGLVLELARPGGDEFSVIVRDAVDEQQLEAVGLEILKALAEPITISSQHLVVTPSVGIAMSPGHGDTPESLLRNADAAMHAAKSDGRGQIRHYDESLNRDAAEKVLLETELRAALELGEQIFMVYQPQIDTRTGDVAGVEALVRWNHPELGNISPVKFIPVAESSGLIIALGDLILRKVNDDAVSAGENFPDSVAISINLSPIQFTQSDFVTKLRETLKDIDSRFKIELELTEGVLMSDASPNLSKLKELKAIGFDLAIDDFGTGYSSLSYLRNFPIDTLKIDRSFVVDLGNEGGDGIVKAILSLSNALGLRTVAEGVETVEQSRFLCENGCTLIQGYLLAKPLTIEDFITVAKNNFTHQLGIRS